MENAETPKKREKTPSDQLRQATLNQYLEAHSKPNGAGWHGFFKSNLFNGLLIWFLGQALLAGSIIISRLRTAAQTDAKIETVMEWKGGVDATLKRMDQDGTVHGHYADERQDKQLTQHELRIDKQEEVTKHNEVNEFEVRQLRKEVEDLKNGKK